MIVPTSPCPPTTSSPTKPHPAPCSSSSGSSIKHSSEISPGASTGNSSAEKGSFVVVTAASSVVEAPASSSSFVSASSPVEASSSEASSEASPTFPDPIVPDIVVPGPPRGSIIVPRLAIPDPNVPGSVIPFLLSPTSSSPTSAVSTAATSIDIPPSPAASASAFPYPSGPYHHNVFRIEVRGGPRAIFIQDNQFLRSGSIFGVQTADMNPAEQPIQKLDDLADVLDTLFIGTVPVGDLDKARDICLELVAPEDAEALRRETEEEKARRCRQWVRETLQILEDDGIMKPHHIYQTEEAPRPQTQAVVRHHHTASCSHQRLHVHHPYRRRRRLVDENGKRLPPAQTIQPR